ncbi:MAG: glycosyltransferase family 4 protein [Sediminibacterium sp.]|jgi:glycosyltransferase involved in cell wall biosynthesis
MKSKLTYFLSHPIQYITPLLQALAKEVELEVYYYSDVTLRGGVDKGFGKSIQWDVPLLEGYKSKFLKNYSSSKAMDCRFGDALNFGVWNVLRKTKSSVVLVNGWTYGTDLMVIFTAWIFGKKVWLRTETPLNQEVQKKGWKQKIKLFVLKYLLFKFFISKFLYIGTQNKNFYNFMGVPDAKLLFTPYAVDNIKFRSEYIKNKEQKTSLKATLSIPKESKVILYAGKYITKKRPLDLIQAFIRLSTPNVHLVLMGDGSLRQEMEHYIVNNQVQNVQLTGFVNQSEVSTYYSVSDVFVMCSGIGETWGLSTNEAMNFGLPIIVSETTGCAIDLVKDNGFVFETGNVEQLAKCLTHLLENDQLSSKYGLNSSKIIDSYSIEKIVSNIKINL